MVDGDGPDNKPTTSLPKVDPAIAELTKIVKDGFARTEANFALISGEVNSLGNRVTELEAARGRASNRVREVEDTTSHNDLEQQAQLAQERAARETLAAKVDAIASASTAQTEALVRLEHIATSLLGNKKVRLAGYVVLVLLMGVAAKFGIHIEVPK